VIARQWLGRGHLRSGHVGMCQSGHTVGSRRWLPAALGVRRPGKLKFVVSFFFALKWCFIFSIKK
jgi:hypothetical protein